MRPPNAVVVVDQLPFFYLVKEFELLDPLHVVVPWCVFVCFDDDVSIQSATSAYFDRGNLLPTLERMLIGVCFGVPSYQCSLSLSQVDPKQLNGWGGEVLMMVLL